MRNVQVRQKQIVQSSTRIPSTFRCIAYGNTIKRLGKLFERVLVFHAMVLTFECEMFQYNGDKLFNCALVFQAHVDALPTETLQKDCGKLSYLKEYMYSMQRCLSWNLKISSRTVTNCSIISITHLYSRHT